MVGAKSSVTALASFCILIGDFVVFENTVFRDEQDGMFIFIAKFKPCVVVLLVVCPSALNPA